MDLNETDFELIDGYLDGQLDPARLSALESRLAGDAGLRERVHVERSQRQARRAIWTALEPDDRATATLADKILAATAVESDLAAGVNDSTVNDSTGPASKRPRVAGWIGPMRYIAAAAACIAIGFIVRPAFERGGPSKDVAKTNAVDVHPVSMYEVTLRDQAGAVVAVQRFDNIEKAQEFAADLSRWQARQEKLAAGRFVVSADRF